MDFGGLAFAAEKSPKAEGDFLMADEWEEKAREVWDQCVPLGPETVERFIATALKAEYERGHGDGYVAGLEKAMQRLDESMARTAMGEKL